MTDFEQVFRDYHTLLSKLRRLRKEREETEALLLEAVQRIQRYEIVIDLVCAQLNIDPSQAERAPILIASLRKK